MLCFVPRFFLFFFLSLCVSQVPAVAVLFFSFHLLGIFQKRIVLFSKSVISLNSTMKYMLHSFCIVAAIRRRHRSNRLLCGGGGGPPSSDRTAAGRQQTMVIIPFVSPNWLHEMGKMVMTPCVIVVWASSFLISFFFFILLCVRAVRSFRFAHFYFLLSLAVCLLRSGNSIKYRNC